MSCKTAEKTTATTTDTTVALVAAATVYWWPEDADKGGRRAGGAKGGAPQNPIESIVAIRGLWWQGNKISLPAGCGIIEASRLVNEWREIRLKRDAVKGFLG